MEGHQLHAQLDATRASYQSKREREVLLKENIARYEAEVVENDDIVNGCVEAIAVVHKALHVTQQRLKLGVDSLVTLAINGVFERPYTFELEATKTPAGHHQFDIVVHEEVSPGALLTLHPKDEMGGGMVDVISFALRVVLWSLQRPQRRALLIMDEPMKFVGKGAFMERAVSMMKKISHELGLQMLVVTHEPEIAMLADRAWVVEHHKSISTATLIDKPSLLQSAKHAIMGKGKQAVTKPKKQKRGLR